MPERFRLRQAFGSFPTGVTVVTVGGDHPHGMTASSFTAVSLQPPMVLACIARSARMDDLIQSAEHFAVSVLGERQMQIARHFADDSRPAGDDEFVGASWAPGAVTGAPVLAGAEAVFECRRGAVHDGGDHIIVVGEVQSFESSTARAPLVFAHGRISEWSPRATQPPTQPRQEDTDAPAHR
ncbi:flavin reductase family protein [Aeromicrobium sp. CF3.5]|uniref:flavin reductase family protein n=1 Tax=Aeromicrobium sp. CF3.5 TaxID=3373078 RepID=UPI003EE71771